MEILAYGEDALTLWAIKERLPTVFHILQDSSLLSTCQVFFRPSFGRSGGDYSPQFGEFDFIILSEQCLYLGESKWDKSSEQIQDGLLNLRSEQTLRHDIFKFYVEEWAYGNYPSWSMFVRDGKMKLQSKGINKPVAPEGSLLASNLQTILSIIKQHCLTLPHIQNVILYFHNGVSADRLPRRVGKDFAVVTIDYSGNTCGNFIRIRT